MGQERYLLISHVWQHNSKIVQESRRLDDHCVDGAVNPLQYNTEGVEVAVDRRLWYEIVKRLSAVFNKFKFLWGNVDFFSTDLKEHY